MGPRVTRAYSWTRLGRVFSPAHLTGAAWCHAFAQAPATLVLDDVVRVYFSCRPAPDPQGRWVSHTAWVDLDRADLTRIVRVATQPILSLGAAGTFDEFGVYPFSPVRFRGRLLGYHGGWTRCESVPFDVAIGLSESFDDGVSFVRRGPGPVLAAAPDEPFILSGPKVQREGDSLTLYYIAGRRWIEFEGRPEPLYRIRRASSSDGEHWERENRDLLPSRLGDHEAQASPDVTVVEGFHHMFFCYREGTDYRTNRARSYRIGYAHSLDGHTWHRDDARGGIDVSNDGGWDSTMVAYPHVLVLDDVTYMFYLGNDVGREGFGLARLDGDLGTGDVR